MNDLFRAFNISASGMYAQRVRMNVIASNLANYESYRANGEPFRKLEVVFQALEDPKNLSKGEVPVRVVEIRQSNEPFRLVYDPTNPRANQEGYVQKPNVELVKEMVDMITAVRSYEANLNAFSATKEIAQRTLELWR
ncbi:flagellar basal body rod protein FlgC [Thermocrinis sp.]|jgi:flagellar basal-body rod protein FlgC|uniref:flagellar basal body rod protein FlgC n=1 Tax=Thermocrinis sp. TaxID=2024383 RepID=UPI0026070A95|nr:flagellar basal body rod protein FlgC [Thermocrinis sp.]MDT7871254.1 flagellar basal body rod protein FlgC [Thermocrinis sp.]